MIRSQILIIFTLFFLSAVSLVFAQQPESKKVINSPNKNMQLPFSDAVLVNNTLYLAGKIGLDPKTGKPPQKVEDEIKLVLDSMKGTLEQAGLTMDNLVYVQVFCPDLTLYNTFNSIYKTYFTKDFPARAFIGSGPLLFGARFEVQGIAAK